MMSDCKNNKSNLASNKRNNDICASCLCQGGNILSDKNLLIFWKYLKSSTGVFSIWTMKINYFDIDYTPGQNYENP